jgi:hypothetical protein
VSIFVDTFNYKNPEYFTQVSGILSKLNDNDLTRDQLNLPAADSQKWNIENYPRIWAETDRIGASTLLLPEELRKQRLLDKAPVKSSAEANVLSENNYYSAHELILIQLAQLQRRYRFAFNKKARDAKKIIENCIEELKKLLENEKLNFLYFTLLETADALKESLQSLSKNQQKYCENIETLAKEKEKVIVKAGHELRNGLQALKNNSEDYIKQMDETFNSLVKDNEITLRTANDSLNLTEKIHNLTKSISHQVKPLAIKVWQKKMPTANCAAMEAIKTINKQANQLNIINKRLTDPFYTKPQARTLSEKVRRGLRIATGTIAIISGVIALILALSGVGAGLSLIFIGISAIGVYAGPDDVYEFIRHFKHGRTPTKKQVITLVVSIVAASLYGLGSHIAVVASHISSISSWIGKQIRHIMPSLNSISDFINRKVHYATNLSNVKEVIDQTLLQTIGEASVVALLSKKVTEKPVSAVVESPNEAPKTTTGLHFFPKVESAHRKFIRMAEPIIKEWEKIPENNKDGRKQFALQHADKIQELLNINVQVKKQHTLQPILSMQATLRTIHAEAVDSKADVSDNKVPDGNIILTM